MRGIADKLVLFFLCLTLLLSSQTSVKPVVVFLFVFIVLAIDELAASVFLSYGLFAAGIVLSLFVPDAMFFLPVLIYPLCTKKRTPLVLPVFLPVLFFIFSLYDVYRSKTSSLPFFSLSWFNTFRYCGQLIVSL